MHQNVSQQALPLNVYQQALCHLEKAYDSLAEVMNCDPEAVQDGDTQDVEGFLETVEKAMEYVKSQQVRQ